MTMIPLGILGASGAAAAPSITSFSGAVWAGGGSGSYTGPGGAAGSISTTFVESTLVGGQTYTITIGAANNSSTALGTTVASGLNYTTSNSTTYYNGGDTFIGPGYYYPWDHYIRMYAFGGGAGAASNGGNAFFDGTVIVSGSGGGGLSTATLFGSPSSVVGLPSTICGGGGGGGTDGYGMNYMWWEEGPIYPGRNGSQGSDAVANSGTGGSAFDSAGYSGGFLLRYADSLPALSATTGTVTTGTGGGYRYYFWKSSGSFTV